MTHDHEAGCLCSAVRYRHGPLRDVVACRCRQCRRTSGHFVAATQASSERLSLVEDRGLQWHESSAGVFRGFCVRCGSSLFRTRTGSGRISIMAGTLDGPTGLRLTRQIHVADRGDYHHIDPDLPTGDNAGIRPDPSPGGNRQEEEA